MSFPSWHLRLAHTENKLCHLWRLIRAPSCGRRGLEGPTPVAGAAVRHALAALSNSSVLSAQYGRRIIVLPPWPNGSSPGSPHGSARAGPARRLPHAPGPGARRGSARIGHTQATKNCRSSVRNVLGFRLRSRARHEGHHHERRRPRTRVERHESARGGCNSVTRTQWACYHTMPSAAKRPVGLEFGLSRASQMRRARSAWRRSLPKSFSVYVQQQASTPHAETRMTRKGSDEDFQPFSIAQCCSTSTTMCASSWGEERCCCPGGLCRTRFDSAHALP